MRPGRGPPSVNVEGIVEVFIGTTAWSPASLMFEVEEDTSRFGMLGREWRET